MHTLPVSRSAEQTQPDRGQLLAALDAAEQQRTLAIARLSDASPERIAFLEGEVGRMTREVARTNPQGPATRGEGPKGHARATSKNRLAWLAPNGGWRAR